MKKPNETLATPREHLKRELTRTDGPKLRPNYEVAIQEKEGQLAATLTGSIDGIEILISDCIQLGNHSRILALNVAATALLAVARQFQGARITHQGGHLDEKEYSVWLCAQKSVLDELNEMMTGYFMHEMKHPVSEVPKIVGES
jgi:hypothetical protein